MAAIGPVPFAGTILADMGAKVVRVDRIPAEGGASGRSGFDQRGRQSVALDLKNPAAVEIALRLTEHADVIMEGFRPGVMERLGLGPEVCLARNPRLIYGRMTGWGQSGPLAHAAGHDLNYIALTGALHAMGSADRPPTPPLNMVGDYGGGGMMLVVGVLAALYERQVSGKGQVIDAAITDGSANLMGIFYSMLAQGQWQDKRAANGLDGGAHYYGVYECADGRYVSIGSIEPKFYGLLLQKCGIDPREWPPQLDASSWPLLRSRLEAVFKRRTREQWCEIMEGTDICFAPVLSLTEAPEHPHNRARGTFIELNGAIQPAPAPRFDRTPSVASDRVAHEGQHTEEILNAIGVDRAEMQRLIDLKAIYCR